MAQQTQHRIWNLLLRLHNFAHDHNHELSLVQLSQFHQPTCEAGTFPGTAWLDTLLVYPVTLCITLVSSAFDICEWPLFIHFCLFLGPSGNIWLFQNPNGRIHVYGEQKLPKFGSDPPPSSIADRKLCWCFAWLLRYIYSKRALQLVVNTFKRSNAERVPSEYSQPRYTCDI